MYVRYFCIGDVYMVGALEKRTMSSASTYCSFSSPFYDGVRIIDVGADIFH
jgi:hypothetical protein